ncbi:SufD family Fe-S cluster assembly protein [Suttonella sp. R2A3]|uniref:SufD family Fe-S cluster assembly protein n=1 Tax=Suttonella sp. R2A3 TaxID=2908648 RepID=UPI0021A8AD1D|nr:SufD family Fe-S cluster assembly protein [Suttonella sp. R2A3]
MCAWLNGRFLDPDALFYLQSRGIDKATAENMLIASFLHEAVVLEHRALDEAMHSAISELWSRTEHD